nr:alpha amylase C-terminal domain-containing protein [Ardenticatenales bacterium]
MTKSPSLRSLYRLVALLFVLLAVMVALPQTTQQAEAQTTPPPRTVFVHLFEWKWTDIAQECETYLGPKGFAAIQVSPPNEHLIAASSSYPWWQRYQPVSYQITSRSGTRAEFANMVSRCKAVGVDIYVDAVINHMAGVESGTGSAGTSFTHYNYPGTYGSADFHYCGRNNGTHDISNYGDRWEVQNCELVNLSDLNTGATYVRDRVAVYMNDLISLGVAGFRIDASKHIAAEDIAAIRSRLNGSPYIYQEVIDQGGEPISASEYFGNGDVTEFKYSLKISETFYSGQLAWLNGSAQFGTGWGFMASDNAVVFVDNHDNQRGHGGGGHIVTFKDGKLYDLANIFMLAWPYGYPQIMSSYDFSNGDQGPPSDTSGNTNSIYSNGTPNCFTQWKCEHRWKPIGNMVAFRNATSSNFAISNWWTNGANQIAFGRGALGYVIINRELGTLNRTFQTSMAAGTYCDVIKGELAANGQSCTGATITVNSSGQATLSVVGMDAAAIHVGAKVSSAPVTTIATTFNEYATTVVGQNVYVVGNVTALGSWNTANAVLLSSATYPTWKVTLNLPP